MDGSANMDDRLSSAAATLILERMAEDRREGRLLEVDHYLRLFPEFGDLVRQEHAGLEAVGPEAPATAGPKIGRFRTLRKIGEGGFGSVWLAEDAELGRQVALKVLVGAEWRDQRTVERFRREAEIAARLDDPAIATVHEFGMEGRTPYIAMRLVPGESLALRIARQRAGAAPTPLAACLSYFETLARALGRAHEAGILHRDIKPANLMIGTDEAPVILDFGLARRTDDAALTHSFELVGTLPYVAPERLRDPAAGDQRADLFSLGVTLFEALTLERPYRGSDALTLMKAHAEEAPPRLRRFSPDLPNDLAAVVEKAIEVDPAGRYSTAHELADDLARIREGRPVAARPVGAIRRFLRAARRRPARTTAILFLTLFAASAGAAGFWLTRTLPELKRARRDREAAARAAREEAAWLGLAGWKVDLSLELFRGLLDERPDDSTSRAGLALTLERLHRPDEALALLPAGFEDPILASVQAALGAHLEASSRPTLSPPPPADAPAFLHFLHGLEAVRAAEAGDAAALVIARQDFESACLGSLENRPVYWCGRAKVAGMAGDADEARRVDRRIRSLWSDSADALFFAGFALHGAGDRREAMSRFRSSLAIDPGHRLSALALGAAMIDDGDYRGGLEIAQAIRREDPTDATARFNAGLALEALGRGSEAIEAYDEGLKLDPEAAFFREKLGIQLVEQGQRDRAELEFAHALQDDPRLEISHRHLVQLLVERDAVEAAIHELVRRTDLIPADTLAWLLLAELEIEKGNDDGARRAAAQARTLLEAHPDPELAGRLRRVERDLD